MITIIVPTLNEAPRIKETLRAIRRSGDCELIVVDGASTDGTVRRATEIADKVILCNPGRAKQMNFGAEMARGKVLLFLHADTLPPFNFTSLIEKKMKNPEVVGGWFDVSFDVRGWQFSLISRCMNMRARMTGIATGDQGIFVRREAFEAIGGYPDWDLMEDVELSRRLKRYGTMVSLRERVTTSARRWQQDGVWNTVFRMWILRAGSFLGISSSVLRPFYKDTR